MVDYDRLSGPQLKVLRKALLAAFASPREDLNLLLSDIDLGDVSLSANGRGTETYVQSVIRESKARGRLGDLVRGAKESRSENPELMMLDARLGLLSNDHRVAQGGLERTVRGAGITDLFKWTNQLMLAAGRTCKIEVPSNSVNTILGSGFLIGPDLVITNYHVVDRVLKASISPEAVKLHFDYALNEGQIWQPKTVN